MERGHEWVLRRVPGAWSVLDRGESFQSKAKGSSVGVEMEVPLVGLEKTRGESGAQQIPLLRKSKVSRGSRDRGSGCREQSLSAGILGGGGCEAGFCSR